MALGRERDTGDGLGDSEDESARVRGRDACLSDSAKVILTHILTSGLALTIFLQLPCPQADEGDKFYALLSF